MINQLCTECFNEPGSSSVQGAGNRTHTESLWQQPAAYSLVRSEWWQRDPVSRVHWQDGREISAIFFWVFEWMFLRRPNSWTVRRRWCTAWTPVKFPEISLSLIFLYVRHKFSWQEMDEERRAAKLLGSTQTWDVAWAKRSLTGFKSPFRTRGKVVGFIIAQWLRGYINIAPWTLGYSLVRSSTLSSVLVWLLMC